MPGIVEREKAVHDFRDFVTSRLAAQSRHIGFVSAPLPVVASTEVDKSEVLNVYLKLHPENEKYRSELSGMFSDLPLISLSKEMWDKTKASLPSVKPR